MMLDDKEWACKSALLFMIKDEKGNGEGMAKKDTYEARAEALLDRKSVV